MRWPIFPYVKLMIPRCKATVAASVRSLAFSFSSQPVPAVTRPERSLQTICRQIAAAR